MSNRNGLGKARRERDAAQARFEITFDANPAPSMIVRLVDAQVVATNPGLREVSGRRNDEVKGRSVRTLKLFVDEAAFERILERLHRNESVSKELLTIDSRTQGQRTVIVSANPIELERDACGIFTFTDVTELKQAQELFSQVFALAPVPATLSDDTNRFTEVNDAFTAFTGYARAEIVGRSFRELGLWPSRADYQGMAEALREDREFHNLDLGLRAKDGTELRVVGSGKVLSVAGKRVLLHIFYDVTERKRSEAQLHLAIQSIMTETRWFSEELISRLNHLSRGNTIGSYQSAANAPLSPRERQVLGLLATGWSNKRMAEELDLKSQTIRNYISRIYEKLEVHSRAEAIVWAREHGLARD